MLTVVVVDVDVVDVLVVGKVVIGIGVACGTSTFISFVFDWLIESDRAICGLLVCKILVNPPGGNEPFGESFVITTDGARTRC